MSPALADGFVITSATQEAQDTYKKILRFLLLNRKYDLRAGKLAKSPVIVLEQGEDSLTDS